MRPDRGLGRVLALPRRAWLTIRYLGWRTALMRVLTFPLRGTPLKSRLGLGAEFGTRRARARAWYRAHGRPVTIVIPTHGDPRVTRRAVRSVRRTTERARVRIVVVDDASAPEHQRALARLRGAEVVLQDVNRGFAATANAGLRRALDSEGDAVLLNSDVIAHRGWLETLQAAAHADPATGLVGAKLIYPDGRIQFAGTRRHPDQPDWFDHRHRFAPADYGAASVPQRVLGVTGACMYVRRDALERLGLLDEAYGMGFEDIDYSLRAWEAGFDVRYEPAAELTHSESATRGREQGERELASQRHFWSRWRGFFDGRDVRGPDGRLRVIYVTEDTGVGGGHRDVFEHLNRLAARGHEVELFTLAPPPTWFELDAPVRTFADYEALTAELAARDAIKVATWWNTAEAVWRASVHRGIPIYFVQDIEISYYPGNAEMRRRVLASYQPEFRYMTISGWNREQLAKIGHDAALVAPGVDLETFRPLEVERREDVVLALGRSNPLKNLPLTVKGWRRLEPRPELWLFGIEPELGPRYGARYIESPSDAGVNELFNQATVFVQTSRHEGFALPPLEAMAAGTPVVSTDAHGNRDFCRHEENCLMVEPEPEAVAAALRRLLGDAELRARLVEGGLCTAADYSWERRIDELESFLETVAAGGRPAAAPR